MRTWRPNSATTSNAIGAPVSRWCRSSARGAAGGRGPRGGGDRGRLPRDRRAQQRSVFDLGGTAQAICRRAPAIVVHGLTGPVTPGELPRKGMAVMAAAAAGAVA